MISDDFINNELIGCSKRIYKSDKKQMFHENRHTRNNFSVKSHDDKYLFRLFLRQSCKFIKDFSVGLRWENADKYIGVSLPIVLLRCQGPHEGGTPLGADIHHSFHIHEITAIDIQERRFSKPSYKDKTDKFSSFQSALFYFVSRCGITNAHEYTDFEHMSQMSLAEL
ncbi:MAG: hypothetical protein FWF80_02565 [Defluviitaleaceae bacterium]|nr:hypothetical protein [Defluviitaleaceae bacterium]